jgi:ABC-type dipeptide/oligopeptide/nickel transport system permease subunit
VIPGLALIGVLLSVNLLGDALRDALDPRLAKELSPAPAKVA